MRVKRVESIKIQKHEDKIKTKEGRKDTTKDGGLSKLAILKEELISYLNKS